MANLLKGRDVGKNKPNRALLLNFFKEWHCLHYLNHMNVKLKRLNGEPTRPLLFFSRFWQIEKERKIRKIILSKSEILCEQLFQALAQKIPDLRIKHNDHWSSISNNGLAMIWMTENRVWGSVKVWFLGDAKSARNFSATRIKLKLTPVPSLFGDCRGDFRISEQDQISQAVELLDTVSYPALIEYRKSRTGVTSANGGPDYVSPPDRCLTL
jgi:hypothetical protein